MRCQVAVGPMVQRTIRERAHALRGKAREARELAGADDTRPQDVEALLASADAYQTQALACEDLLAELRGDE